MVEASEFFAAVRDGDVARVRALLDADPELAGRDGPAGTSPALAALHHGHPALADELAARSGPLSVFEAAAFDDTERLAELIEQDPEVLDAFSPDGWQPLHLAARFGRPEAARVLLDGDATVFEPSRNELRAQPLHSAVAGRHAEIVWLLLASDADVGARQHGGASALHIACGNGDVESIRALLAAGADPDQADDQGRTPRMLAPDDLHILFDDTGAV
jgi:ankyrin repeat protein